LILLRAIAITFAMRMAGRRRILAGLHDAARETSRVSEHQRDGEQDQNFAQEPTHFLSA